LEKSTTTTTTSLWLPIEAFLFFYWSVCIMIVMLSLLVPFIIVVVAVGLFSETQKGNLSRLSLLCHLGMTGGGIGGVHIGPADRDQSHLMGSFATCVDGGTGAGCGDDSCGSDNAVVG
jgi:hypothetical protein